MQTSFICCIKPKLVPVCEYIIKWSRTKKMLIAFYYGWSDTLLFAISDGLSHECERILYCFSPKTEIRMNGKQQEMLREKKTYTEIYWIGAENETNACLENIFMHWPYTKTMRRPWSKICCEWTAWQRYRIVMSLVTCNMQYGWIWRVRFECVVAYKWFVLNWTFNRWFRFKSKFMLKYTILLL